MRLPRIPRPRLAWIRPRVRPKIWRGIGALRRAPSAAIRRAAGASARRRRITIVLLAVVTLAVVAATTVLGLAERRAEDITNARFDAVVQARQRVAEILTYSADTIDADIERARQATAGAFAQYYVPFAQRVIAPAVQQAGTSSAAVVSRAAAVSVSPDTVVVVVFIDQRTSSKAQPEPRSMSSTARVTMTNVAGQWLISELTPTSS